MQQPIRRAAAVLVLAGTAVALGGAGTSPGPTPSPSALYKVVFEASWSEDSHGGAYPGGAHFSPLVGATHSAGVRFFRTGQPASPGIEAMAELGATYLLDGEIQQAIDAGTAGAAIHGNGVAAPGLTSVTFTATIDHPLLTLVSMIAPSPDWFVGVSGRRLMKNGQWREKLVIPLRARDAGTDSGSKFGSEDFDTVPQQDVRKFTKKPFAGRPALGRFIVTRIDT